MSRRAARGKDGGKGMGRVVITRPYNGLVAMQVCVVKDATDEEILAVCNKENPSGTSLGWCEVVRKALEDRPESGPIVCANDAERLHLLVIC